MGQAIDLTGQRFGKLTAIEVCGKTKHGATLWRLKCDCGGETQAHTGELRAGKRKACWCGNDTTTTHGMSRTRLYRVWMAMRERCTRQTHPRFARYGGRGISVCGEWMAFEPFRDWALVNGYSDDLQIDRINNDGNYEPSNCRFVTASQNMANRSCSRKQSQAVA